MWAIKFPREIATPKRRLCYTKEEYLDYIKHAIRLTNLYTTVYNFTDLIDKGYYSKIDYDSAIIDRLYFDCDYKIKGQEVDGYINMLKLHEWCVKNGNIKHQCYFTGSAYSVILAVTHNGLENNNGAIYNAQVAITDELEIVTDPQVMGDTARITRIPNTFNFKETARRYAIPLKEEQLYMGDGVIRELAKKQQFGVKPIGDGAYNIAKYDCEKTNGRNLQMPLFDVKDIVSDIDVGPDAPDCILRMLQDEELGYKARPILIMWLRDKGFLLEETISILKKSLSERKFRHCVFEEKQPQIMYQRMMNMYLPKCRTICSEGFCNCVSENECGKK